MRDCKNESLSLEFRQNDCLNLPSLSMHCATRQAQVRTSLTCDNQLLDSSFDSHFSVGADVSEQAAKDSHTAPDKAK